MILVAVTVIVMYVFMMKAIRPLLGAGADIKNTQSTSETPHTLANNKETDALTIGSGVNYLMKTGRRHSPTHNYMKLEA